MLNALRQRRSMPRVTFTLRLACLLSVVAFALLLGSQGSAQGAHAGFGFNGDVADKVFLTGGGSFNPDTGFLKSGGGFRCTATITTGPLAGCAEGEGVRWDSDELLASSGFKCIGSESLKTAFTGDGVVVMRAEFYRAGDGTEESFVANMFVSDHDLDPDVDGVQNLWIAGVGCGPAVVHFSS
jgi:hypothetical protein